MSKNQIVNIPSANTADIENISNAEAVQETTVEVHDPRETGNAGNGSRRPKIAYCCAWKRCSIYTGIIHRIINYSS